MRLANRYLDVTSALVCRMGLVQVSMCTFGTCFRCCRSYSCKRDDLGHSLVSKGQSPNSVSVEHVHLVEVVKGD